MLAVHFPPISC